MFVAEDTSNIVGFAAGSLFWTDHIFEKEVTSIYLLQEFQHKGIGKLLINAMVRRFVENDARSMILWTLQENSSRLFYEHLGGKIVGKRIINRGGKELLQIAYAWEDLNCLM